MKFYNYINENISLDYDIRDYMDIDDLKKNCSYYLKWLKKNNIPFPFTRNMDVSLPAGIKNVKKDRKPKGTDERSFKFINNWLEERGLVRRDKAVIATSINRLSFGDRYYIFPVRKFDYTYIKDIDFNGLRNSQFLSTKLAKRIDYFLSYGDTFQSFNKEMENAFKLLITKRKPWIAWKNGYEIWFECDKYYYIDYNYKGSKELIEEIMS